MNHNNMQKNWRTESEAVLHSPTKRELQARESVHRTGFRSQTQKCRNAYKTCALVVLVLVVVLIAVLVPVVVTRAALKRLSITAYCDGLPDKPKMLCTSYMTAQGASKSAAAAEWRNASPTTYACAGIEESCLSADVQSSNAGTFCQPLTTGARCGDQQQTCQAGSCGGPAAEAQQVVAASFDAQDAPSTNVSASMPEILLYRTPAVSAAPNASWPTAVASVWPDKKGLRVPETFLATSHEWKRIEEYGGVNVQAWADIFGILSDSPVLRVGGASQDAMTEAPGPDVWNALVRFQKASNCRYIIGLPLWQKNAVELSKQIMKDAQNSLGDSLMGFELGNEPEFWPTGLGGYDKGGKWVPGFDAFAAQFRRVALSLNPCNRSSTTNKRLLSGPGWGNVNTQEPSWFAKIVDQGAGCYFWESNTHYYPYVNNETVTSHELLSQGLQDFALDKFKAYAQISKSYGLNIRISETNSMYGGGRKGLSETMAGTLWTTDALFAFANAGARAFHLHWGMNGDAPPSVGVQTNFDKVPDGQPPLPGWPSVHAPWFGYMMWTTAASGGYGKPVDTNFVVAEINKRGNCTANIKVWALRSDADEIRIALINKDLEKSCNIKIRLDVKFCSNAATLSRLLPGNLGMESKAGVTWQGQHYMGAGTTGKIQGTQEADVVVAETQPSSHTPTSCSYNVALPRTSAALLTVAPEKPAI